MCLHDYHYILTYQIKEMKCRLRYKRPTQSSNRMNFKQSTNSHHCQRASPSKSKYKIFLQDLTVIMFEL